MDVTNSNADAINTYNELAQELAATNDDVMLGKMFGMPCINVNRKAFAGLFQDDMVFKLTGDAHAQALQLEGARLFDPSNMGRPMKEWVQVPFAHAASWAGMAAHALAYVGKR